MKNMMLKTLRNFSLLLLPGFLMLHEAAAVDPACEPYLKACEARAMAPAWQSVTEVSSKLKVEAMKAGGQFYSRMNGGDWKKLPVSVDATERKLLADIRSGSVKLTECKNEGSEAVGGVNTSVISYRLEMPGAPAATGKLNIGKADGLPYAQVSNATKSSYSYKNVSAPAR